MRLNEEINRIKGIMYENENHTEFEIIGDIGISPGLRVNIIKNGVIGCAYMLNMNDSYELDEDSILFYDNSQFCKINCDKNFFNNDNSVYLHSLEVLPEYRGNGYGMMLMKKLLELVKNMGYKYATYISDKNNTQAEKIYNNLGRKIYHTDDKSNFSFFQLH